jgi:L-seryl-tRNA(Ser) seleniumtransferase
MVLRSGAPHHGLGRPLKVGKEEIMGLVAAVDAWGRRDHTAERAAIDARLAHIQAAIEGGPAGLSPSVSCEIVAGMDGAPRAYISHRLRVSWNGPGFPTPAGVVQQLLQHDPPIALIEWKQGVDICAHVITMEEARQIAQALVAVLTAPPTSKL